MRTFIQPTLFSLALILLTQFAMAQSKKLVPKRVKAEAEEYLRVEEYHHAYDLYKILDSIQPNLDNHYQLGMICVKMNKKKEALTFLRKALHENTSSKPYDKLYFFLGRAYHLNNEFDSAIKYYDKYKEALTDEMDHEDISKEDIERFDKQCLVGKELLKRPIEVQIKNIGTNVNTKYHEFAPLISADETRLIFTSRRPSHEEAEVSVFNNDFHEDVYMSEKDDNGKWKKAVRMTDNINSSGHDASIALSPDGQWLYLYRGGAAGDNMSGDIYYSQWDDEAGWSEPEKMPKGINSKYWEPSASITENEMTFFFTSDRQIEGAQGGRDIYIVRKLPNGEWAEPENLGPPINTPFDEDGPFIHSNGRTLYFSSNSPKSMGGFDIFISHYNPQKGEWSEPQNLGYPINTAEDDIYFVWSADGVRGYFSSERDDSNGNTDIYQVSIPEKELNLIVLKGKIFDEDTKKSIGATIEVIDNETQKTVFVSNSNSFNGRYTIVLPPNRNYGIRVGRTGYLFKSLNINIPEQFEYLEIVENIGLKKVAAPPKQNTEGDSAITSADTPGEVEYEELNNVYFSKDNDVRVESEAELNRLKMLLDADPSLNIEVAVHTDNQEDSLVSLFKSQARADAIVNFLKKIGADKERVKGVGYGSNYPIASNETEKGREKNNRVEYIATYISTEELDNISYENVNPEVNKNKEFAAINKKLKDVPKDQEKRLPIGSLLQLEHAVRFKLGTSRLNDDAKLAIEEVIEYMDKYPDMIVEVGGHTDHIGSAAYNQILSESRASAVAQVLVYKGGDKKRLKIVGYGEAKPIATNDTPEGRNLNRRTEFKVVGWGVE